jgi:dephospho-CoA kinase/inosine/xanthosine triphosphate pyrophosphatase family protein
MDKYLQARRVFEKHLIQVDYFKGRMEPYEEDYSGTSEDLLTAAIEQVTSHVGGGHLVFIEDTSLRLEAFSSSIVDSPGMRVKHWFEATTFEQCDAAIKSHGGDRRAIVKSDIALKIPGVKRPVFFHGESSGSVATTAPEFSINPQYPWLTPHTFNGWFIPDGCFAPLGALEVEEAFAHDFRIRAFEKLIERLEEYSGVLNLPGSAYRRRRTLRTPRYETPSLFATSSERPSATLLVVGRTCAGKTTLAEYISGHHGMTHIEASSVVRSLGEPRLDTDDSGGFDYAMRVLNTKGRAVVAQTIVERYGGDLERPVVISGLRDIEEVKYMKESIPGSMVVLVEAPERTRFERHIRRGRQGAETRLLDFRKRDRRQDEFGLLPVVEDLADVRVLNDGRLVEFHYQIDGLLEGRGDTSGVELHLRPRHGPNHNQLFRCLTILESKGGALSCDEIQRLSTVHGTQEIRHNNANKVLKAVPALVDRLDPSGGEDSARVRYEIREAGRTYLTLMQSRPGYGATA